jgi:spermidine synthase
LLRSGGRRRSVQNAALAAVLAITAVTFPDGTTFWARLHGLRPGKPVIVGEDRTGIAVLSHELTSGELFIGGHRQSAVPFAPIHGILGLLGGLVHPHPRDVFVVGHGTGGTPYGAGGPGTVERVRVVEIVGPVFDVMTSFSLLAGGTLIRSLFQDPRYERVVGDARRELFKRPKTYDVIEADAIYPRSSHSGLLYSSEYFQQIRERLNPNGIVVQWVPTPRIARTFLGVFPYAVELPSSNIFLGSNEPIPFDIEAVARRIGTPAVKAYVEAAGWSPAVLEQFLRTDRPRYWSPDQIRPEGDVNTDLFPKDEFYLNSAMR